MDDLSSQSRKEGEVTSESTDTTNLASNEAVAEDSAQQAGDTLGKQAKEMGVAALDFGKKTGKFAFNLLKKGLALASDAVAKQKNEYDRKRAEHQKSTSESSDSSEEPPK